MKQTVEYNIFTILFLLNKQATQPAKNNHMWLTWTEYRNIIVFMISTLFSSNAQKFHVLLREWKLRFNDLLIHIVTKRKKIKKRKVLKSITSSHKCVYKLIVHTGSVWKPALFNDVVLTLYFLCSSRYLGLIQVLPGREDIELIGTNPCMTQSIYSLNSYKHQTDPYTNWENLQKLDPQGNKCKMHPPCLCENCFMNSEEGAFKANFQLLLRDSL